MQPGIWWFQGPSGEAFKFQCGQQGIHVPSLAAELQLKDRPLKLNGVVVDYNDRGYISREEAAGVIGELGQSKQNPIQVSGQPVATAAAGAAAGAPAGSAGPAAVEMEQLSMLMNLLLNSINQMTVVIQGYFNDIQPLLRGGPTGNAGDGSPGGSRLLPDGSHGRISFRSGAAGGSHGPTVGTTEHLVRSSGISAEYLGNSVASEEQDINAAAQKMLIQFLSLPDTMSPSGVAAPLSLEDISKIDVQGFLRNAGQAAARKILQQRGMVCSDVSAYGAAYAFEVH